MAEKRTDCDRFDQWLIEGGTGLESSERRRHRAGCAECQKQWRAHQMLAATFAEEPVPELSAAFEAGLTRKLGAGIEVRPLRGWRKAALLAYVAAAAGLLGWALRGAPLPTIDPAAPWVPVAAFIAVPLTLLLAIAASRWIPGPGLPRSPRALAP